MSLADNDLSPAAEAYVWGFPLVSVHRTRLMLCSRVDSGSMNHIDDLATPKDRGIVVPNNDTLYSSAWYDLRYGDLMIRVPPMDHPQRYWNVMILDGYTHVAYVCRRHHGTQGTEVRVTLDPSQPPANDDSAVITVGTPTAWVIIRVLVESPEDLAAARRLQRRIEVIAPEAHPRARTERVGRATEIAQSGAAVFEELHQYVEARPACRLAPQALSSGARDHRGSHRRFPSRTAWPGSKRASAGCEVSRGQTRFGRTAGARAGMQQGSRAIFSGARPVQNLVWAGIKPSRIALISQNVMPPDARLMGTSRST